MTPRAIPVFVAALALGAGPSAWAQTSPVTVTPFVAFGTAGASPVGVMVTVPVTAALSVESEVAYRRGEGNINAMSAQLSLLQDLPTVGRITPYLAGGVGMAQYGAPVFGETGAPTGRSSRLAMTVNAGGGFTVPVRSGLDYRTDVRYFDGLGTAPDQFRIANGISFGARRSKTP